MLIYERSGVVLELDGVRLCLDGESSADLTFISHAHMDHLIKKPLIQPVIASRITKELCYKRVGLKLRENLITDEFNGLKIRMLDNGHVPGSKALLIEGSKRILYTSDFSLHNRYFIKGFKPISCDILIMETTYGSPEYIFENPSNVLKQASLDIAELINAKKSIVLMGYAFGKAQIISKLVEKYDNVYVHKSIKEINDILLRHSIPLRDFPTLSLKNLKTQFIAITPQFTPSNPTIQALKKKGAVILAFTGWSKTRSLGADKSYQLSDHADFKDLLKTVKSCNPELVYTHHGFAQEFAELLRLEGFDAKSLESDRAVS